jgi:hypothetical protein
MKQLLATLFPQYFNPSVDGALTAFNKALAKLEKVSVHHVQKALKHEDAVKAHEAAKAHSYAESVRADNITKKLKAIYE